MVDLNVFDVPKQSKWTLLFQFKFFIHPSILHLFIHSQRIIFSKWSIIKIKIVVFELNRFLTLFSLLAFVALPLEKMWKTVKSIFLYKPQIYSTKLWDNTKQQEEIWTTVCDISYEWTRWQPWGKTGRNVEWSRLWVGVICSHWRLREIKEMKVSSL